MTIAMAMPIEQKLKVRAAANDWVSRHVSDRTRVRHIISEHSPINGVYTIVLSAENGPSPVRVGELLIDEDGIVVEADDLNIISSRLATLKEPNKDGVTRDICLIGDGYEFRLGDGVKAASEMGDKTIDLLLTDPPYGISSPYTCENQVPRRLRNDGSDFIMPRGHFGDWDSVQPEEWTESVLPTVGGWAVIFCAQAQIGVYSDILRAHKFNSVGTLVWQKTNPVPFNHKYKPINAWEALVVGKRPGTPFNGRVVHNVFICKSPSPQQRIHPTQKPVPLLERFIELFSSEGNLVCDPFAGSASTLIAAHKLRRRAVAYEANQEIFQLAYERIQKEVGRDALSEPIQSQYEGVSGLPRS